MQEQTMQARMPNLATIIPDSLPPIMAMMAAIATGGVPPEILELTHLRASQINGCSTCVHAGAKSARKAGLSDDQLMAVAAWRDAPFFSGAERAALSLTEAMTRLADRADPVPDLVWDEAARQFDEPALAALVLSITMTNFFNRINIATRQVAGTNDWG
jgi:AhpD family alkylhydroperoxidase